MQRVLQPVLVLLFVQRVLQPVFTENTVTGLDQSAKLSLALDGTKYIPGIVGLNNIKVYCVCVCVCVCYYFVQANDYMNVVLQTLAHVSPFRDYFLREESYSHISPPPGDTSFILGYYLLPMLSLLLCTCCCSHSTGGTVSQAMEPSSL